MLRLPCITVSDSPLSVITSDALKLSSHPQCLLLGGEIYFSCTMAFAHPYIHCHGFWRLYSSSQVFSFIAILLSPNFMVISQNMLHGSSCNTYNWNTCGKDTNWNLPEQMLFFQSKFTTRDLMCLDVSLNASTQISNNCKPYNPVIKFIWSNLFVLKNKLHLSFLKYICFIKWH